MIDTLPYKEIPIELVAQRLGIDVRRHRSLCFMHDDHHPSLNFYVRNNSWFCFVCDRGGDSISLVMEYLHVDFKSALAWLAENFNIDAADIPSTFTSAPQPRSANSVIQPQAVPTILDSELVSHFRSNKSSFCRAMRIAHLLTEKQIQQAAERYRLGCTRDGGVIFWQINQHGQLLEGKVMYYLNNGHRSHIRNPYSVSWMLRHQGETIPDDFRASRCLFGLHQLGEFNKNLNPIIAIVESEKTAIICSQLKPQIQGQPVIWMATGGLHQLSLDMLSPLQGYRILLFPDTDPEGKAYARWQNVANEAKDRYALRIRISDILEQMATPEEKSHKIDLADWVTKH